MLLDDLNRLTEHHMANCGLFLDYVNALFDKGPAKTIAEVPYLPVRAFKSFDLKSIPEADVYKTMTSSGTSGQVSRIYLDKETAQLQTKTLVEIFAKTFSSSRFPMLVIDAESTVADRTRFSARTAAINGFSLFSRGRAFALKDDLSLDLPRIRAFIEQHGHGPIFVFGFTFLVWQALVEGLKARGETLDLSKAFLLHGGGWKKLQDRQVSNARFKEEIATWTGCANVRNYYGMVEQTGTICMECEHGHLHAAEASDVLIRDPNSFAPLPHGQEGLIQVFSSIQKSYPGHSLLTEDVGSTQAGASCACGRSGTIVHIKGRLQQAEVRGCSDAYSS